MRHPRPCGRPSRGHLHSVPFSSLWRNPMSRRLFAVVALCALGAAACVSERAVDSQAALVEPGLSNLSAGEQQYILDATTTLPGDLAAKVAAIGGRLTGTLPEIGVASAVS